MSTTDTNPFIGKQRENAMKAFKLLEKRESAW